MQKKKKKGSCKGCESDEEEEEALNEAEKIERLEEEKDTGQHSAYAEERKCKQVHEEDWKDSDAQ